MGSPCSWLGLTLLFMPKWFFSLAGCRVWAELGARYVPRFCADIMHRGMKGLKGGLWVVRGVCGLWLEKRDGPG